MQDFFKPNIFRAYTPTVSMHYGKNLLIRTRHPSVPQLYDGMETQTS